MSAGFHPVIHQPPDVQVLDLSSSAGVEGPRTGVFSVGRYNEVRCIYTQPLFGGTRNIHVGIDLGAPPGTPVHAFMEGEVFAIGNNDKDGDYGPTLVTRHQLEGEVIWALFGHLSLASLEGKATGQLVARGEVLGWVGQEGENGGWPPHVHFQLSRVEPAGADLPGVVTADEREQALRDYPDPRRVLGPIY
jgi:murein DD-endopeptidase MepM/ murein hydrolase activator NlpD